MSIITYANLASPVIEPELRLAIKAMFLGGEKGVLYDLTDPGTLYQNTARTTLVAANGDPIASATDLSGNGAHAAQATTTSRPLFQGYADFDGVDDSWATPAIDFTATDAVTVVASVRKANDNTAFIAELSANSSSNAGTFALMGSNSGLTGYFWRSRGTSDSSVNTGSIYPAPNTSVLSGQGDISSDTSILRVNGTPYSSASDQGTGSYGNRTIYIGRRGGATFPFGGRIYRLMVIGRALTPTELALAEQWCAEPAGVTLP